MEEKFKKTLRPYIVFLTILFLVGIGVYFQQSINETFNNAVIKRDSIAITLNVTDTTTKISIYHEELLRKQQLLKDSLLMEVTGQSSGKAGYGKKAKAIQKQLEEIEKTIEVLQLYSPNKENIDTTTANKK